MLADESRADFPPHARGPVPADESRAGVLPHAPVPAAESGADFPPDARGPAPAAESRSQTLADRVFSHHDTSLNRIAIIAYELMGLPRPAHRPTAVAVPAPRKPHPAPMSWWFRAAISDHDITITRWPAHQPGTRLLAHVHDPDPRLPAAATVLIGTTDLAAHPDAYVAADGLHLAVRDHGTVHAEPESALDPTLIAAAVHAWTHQAHQPLDRELRVNRTVVRFEASTRR